MTPEQKAKLEAIVASLETTREGVYEEMRRTGGNQAVEEHEQAMAESVAGFSADLEEFFLTSVEEAPLLAIGLANMIGAQLQHVKSHADDMSPKEFAELLEQAVTGSLETIVHLTVLAVRGGSGG